MVDDSDLAIAEKALHRAAESAQAREWLQDNLHYVRRATKPIFLVFVVYGPAAVVILAALALHGRGNTEFDVGPWILWSALFVEATAVFGLGIVIVRLSKVFVASKILMDAAAGGPKSARKT